MATCRWHYKYECEWEYYEGECGATWYFTEGDPNENNMNYCPNCGKKLLYERDSGKDE